MKISSEIVHLVLLCFQLLKIYSKLFSAVLVLVRILCVHCIESELFLPCPKWKRLLQGYVAFCIVIRYDKVSIFCWKWKLRSSTSTETARNRSMMHQKSVLCLWRLSFVLAKIFNSHQLIASLSISFSHSYIFSHIASHINLMFGNFLIT